MGFGSLIKEGKGNEVKLSLILEEVVFMDWYYGCGVNDFLVPEDEDLLDRRPSPDIWSEWGISASEGLNSPRTFMTVDTDARGVELNFIEESFSEKMELEPSLHDKEQCSSSSVCGGLPEQSSQQTGLSCDESNFQLQDLSSFEQIDDIFLDSVLDGLSCVENLQRSYYLYPEKHCSNTPGGLHKDIAASKFVPCNSKSKDWLDVEAPTVRELDPYEQCSRDEASHEHLSLEESVLQDLETVVAQFNETTRMCFRDALYRLAHDTKQQVVVESLDETTNMQNAMAQEVRYDTMRSAGKKPMESETNSIDRAVANLMFNKMEINLQDLPLAAYFNMQDVIGSKGLKGNGSKDLNLAQNFPYPQPRILHGDAEVPSFGQREQQTSAESHVEYMQIL